MCCSNSASLAAGMGNLLLSLILSLSVYASRTCSTTYLAFSSLMYPQVSLRSGTAPLLIADKNLLHMRMYSPPFKAASPKRISFSDCMMYFLSVIVCDTNSGLSY